MLTLITGRAGSGKTSYMLDKIKSSGKKSILMVPEQNSHEMEKKLCRFCGDSSSLYAQVLSFSRLSDRVFEETGGLADEFLDKGGRILTMRLAVQAMSGRLKVFSKAANKTEFLIKLIETYDEFKSCGIDYETLNEVSKSLPFADKAADLTSIFLSYEAISAQTAADPQDRLAKLAEKLEYSSIDAEIYIDGFSDFTVPELDVIDALMKKKLNVFCALCCDNSEEEQFEVQMKTKHRLIEMAKQRGGYEELHLEGEFSEKPEELVFLERQLFSQENDVFGKDSDAIELGYAQDADSECEAAAAKVRWLVREKGYRYRDIAVTARNFSRYEAESIFARYDIPVFVSRKEDILQKPVITLVTSALDCVSGGWEYENMFRFLKTGLGGLDMHERDILENYVLKWKIRGRRMWTQEDAWSFNPQGYEKFDEKSKDQLLYIDELRRKAAMPLETLYIDGQSAQTAAGQVMAVYNFMENIGLAQSLEKKSEEFYASRRFSESGEYAQIWRVLTGVLQQCSTILGEMPMKQDEFGRLFKMVLSQYDVGSIPASMDAVDLGDMQRMRQKNIKCLLLLGADRENLPGFSESAGILSEKEREELSECGIELRESFEERYLRELGLIYTCLTQPAEYLYVSYSQTGGKGKPSEIYERIMSLFEKSPEEIDSSCAAILPCFETALSDSTMSESARAYFADKKQWAEKIENIRNAVQIGRGRLSEGSVKSLYGDKLYISASRVDKYNSCQFSYFMQYGLRAKQREEAGFEAPEVGTFIHYIIENVTRELKRRGGFKENNLPLEELTRKWAKRYAKEVLNGCDGKSERFKYLFERLISSACEIVRELVEELRCSDFEPLDFELRFAGNGELSEIKKGDLVISGIVDRVDGWVKDGRLYLRVVDYKTGKKSFDLSDIWYGMGIQMLLYLFVLESSNKYSMPVVPAGVLYAPAREVIIKASRNTNEEQRKKKAERSLRRSGLLLNDKEVLEAMEHGDNGFLPVKRNKDGEFSGDALASLERFGRLAGYIDEILIELGNQIKSGSINADPYYKGTAQSACDFCEFFEACHFDENCDKKRKLASLKTNEVWNRIEGKERPWQK